MYNGNPRHNSENGKAYTYAEKHNLIPTSGSDFHRPEDCARGGVLLNNPISRIEEFVQILKSRSFELIQTEKQSHPIKTALKQLHENL